jgi:hypothetical protein
VKAAPPRARLRVLGFILILVAIVDENVSARRR